MLVCSPCCLASVNFFSEFCFALMTEEQPASFMPVQRDVASGEEIQYRFSDGDIFNSEGENRFACSPCSVLFLRSPSSSNIVFSLIDRVNYSYVLARWSI